jgi:hypothetical protein
LCACVTRFAPPRRVDQRQDRLLQEPHSGKRRAEQSNQHRDQGKDHAAPGDIPHPGQCKIEIDADGDIEAFGLLVEPDHAGDFFRTICVPGNENAVTHKFRTAECLARRRLHLEFVRRRNHEDQIAVAVEHAQTMVRRPGAPCKVACHAVRIEDHDGDPVETAVGRLIRHRDVQ